MFLKTIIAKLTTRFGLNTAQNTINGPIENVIVIVDSKNRNENQITDLKEASRFIEEDYKFSFFELDSDEITLNFLKNFDFIINATFSSESKYLESILNQVKLSKGLILSSKFDVKSQKLYSRYDVLWFFDFEFLNRVKHSRKFHAYSYIKEEDQQPNWNIPYYGNQIKKGLMSVIKDNTRTSNRLYSQQQLKVGKDSFYNSRFQIIGKASYVEIGSYCSIGNNVKLYTTNHDVNYPTTQGYLYRKYFKTNHPGEDMQTPSSSRTKGPIIIKNDVWIGDDVKIMSGVSIGNGACIAAGSVVTKDVGDFEIVGGVPAQFLKHRFSKQVITFLNDIKWWEWSDKKIQRNKDFFRLNLNEVEHTESLKINP